MYAAAGNRDEAYSIARADLMLERDSVRKSKKWLVQRHRGSQKASNGIVNGTIDVYQHEEETLSARLRVLKAAIDQLQAWRDEERALPTPSATPGPSA
jgi:hypothetical protein